MSVIDNVYYWKDKAYAFFCNEACEFYPCHSVEDGGKINCLFCYCPLFALDDKCGGNFRYLTGGVKDCSNCNLPHKLENYGYICEKTAELTEIIRLKHDSI